MKAIVLGFVFGLGSLATFAQPTCAPVLQWQKSFGTPGSEQANDVQQTLDGGFIIGGLSAYHHIPGGNKTSPDYGVRDFWIVRTDADGNKLWDRSYGGSDDEIFQALDRTSDGGFILGGTTWNDSSGGNKTSANYGNSDFWVVRTDAAGIKLWDRSFGGAGYDSVASLQQTADGGFVLAGSSSSEPGAAKTARHIGADDFWVVRLDAEGNKLWDHTFGGPLHDRPSVIRQTADGGFVIAGTTEGLFTNYISRGFGQLDYWVVRIDASGNRLWDSIFGGSDRDQLTGMALTSDGGCLIGGWSRSRAGGNKTSVSYGNADFWVVRLDASGNKVWEKSYGGVQEDMLESIAANSDGGFLLAGYSSSPPGGSKTTPIIGGLDYWLIRVDAHGNEIWQTALGGENTDLCRATRQTADGGYILAGISSSLGGDRHGRGFGSDDYWLVKIIPENLSDCDHDGVPNTQDQCAGTPLGSIVNAQGCSIAQICPCSAESHDEYVGCVRDTARAFQQAGLINNPHRRQLVENARAANCPPSSGPGEGFIFGLPHRVIGNAVVNFQPDWFAGLQVYTENSDSEPVYGISIALGEADSGLFIYPDGNYANYGDNWFFDVKAYGRRDGGDGHDLISSVRVRKPYYEIYPVDVDLSPLRPESLTIQVLSNRTVIAETTVPGASASFTVSGQSYPAPRGNPYWPMPDGSVGVLVEFTNPFGSIYIGGSEDEVFRGDKIFVRANHPRRRVQHISRVDAIAGGGVPGFEFRNERLGMFRHPHQALGSVLFNASGGHLQVNALEALRPEDYAAVLVEAPAAASRLELDLEPVALEETGATLVFYPAGEAFVFAEARVTRAPDELTLLCDYRALFDPASSDPPLVRLEVLSNGRLAGTLIFSNAVASGTLALRDGRAPRITGCRSTINSNGIPTLGLSFAHNATFTGPDGAELRGNHIRVTPLNPAHRVQSISAITVEMIEHQSITITGERSTLLPPALSIQPTASQLLVSWSDSTQLYSLESAPSLAGPFTPLTNEVELINYQNTLTLPISSQGTRFFRLTAPAD